MGWQEETIGDCRLICGNCLDVLPTLARDAAVVSDPPYGMRWATRTARFSGGQTRRGPGRQVARPIQGDDGPFDPAPWLRFPEVILWGANHYAQRLPPGTTLVWLKRFDDAFGTFLSDAELAWQKGGHGVYCYREVTSFAATTTRLHPAQKPLGLLRWCVSRVRAPLIVDPYMGVASTGVACVELGRRFVGIELDPGYWAVGCQRIREAYQQLPLWAPPQATAPTQLGFGWG